MSLMDARTQPNQQTASSADLLMMASALRRLERTHRDVIIGMRMTMIRTVEHARMGDHRG